MNRIKATPSLLPKQWQIPKIFSERLGSSPGKQRIMSEEGQYLIILHKVPSAIDRGIRKAALFWINQQGEWKSSPDSGGINGLTSHIKEYEEKLKALEVQLDSPSVAKDANLLHHIHDEATPLYRASRHLLAIMQELRELFQENRNLLLLRDTAVNIERSAELLLADTKSSLDFITLQSSLKQAEEAHKATLEANRLNRLAALFFPVITIASILSIENPEKALSNPITYFILFVGIALGIALLQILKTKKN